MMRRLFGVVVLGVAALGAAFVFGMRRKSPAVLGAVRTINREVFNPRQMKEAGQPGSWASVIRHRGRRTGHEYETPVVAIEDGDGFVVALPYGDQSDWLKNVLHSGIAGLVHDGETHPVDKPEVVPISEVDHLFSESDQQAHRIFGVVEALRLHRAEIPAAP
ncbi:MAG: nitroreductase family deazaflavin-dependent oxidoreductase [Acidimicrobiia bacterium]|nr:nitroreductase family deazaflavin-dependent oxidoreductase [Acidimicrobiia bacterium]